MAPTRAEKFSTWGSRGLALVAAVMTGVFLVGIAPSDASPGDRSSASGTFLSGSLVSAIDGALNTSATQNLGTTATQIDRHNLNASVLNGFTISLPGNLGIPVHLTNAGALSSYARSDPDASSVGASGLVGNDGVIGVGTVPPSQVPGNLTFDLHDILGAQLTGELADAHLDLGALSASASSSQGGTPVGKYEIAGGKLRLTSNTLKSLNSIVTPRVSALQTTVQGQLTTGAGTLLTNTQNSLKGLLNVLPGLISTPAATNNSSITVDLTSVTLPQTLTTSDGSVSINLTTGEITADLSKINGGLNNLDPNTEILSAQALQAISGSVLTLVGSAVDQLQANLITAIRSAAVNLNVQIAVAGTPAITVNVAAPLGQLLDGTYAPTAVKVTAVGLTLSVGQVVGLLTGTLGTLLTQTTGSVNTAITALRPLLITPVTNTLQPVLALVNTVLSLRANVQSPSPAQAGRPFSETALQLRLLNFSAGGGDVLTLNLANGEVGGAVDGNAKAVAPRVDGISPSSGPEAGGTVVTITGAGFTGATGATFGGTPGIIQSVTDTQITVKTPYHVAGAVPVIVTTAAGASLPGSFTYVPALALTSAVPNTGPLAGGTTVILTGSCLDTVTGVTFGGTAGTIVSRDSAQQLTVTTPAHIAGTVDVGVTSAASCGTTATLPGGFTYANPLPLTPAIATITPNHGPETGGTVVTIGGVNLGVTGTTGVTFDGIPATSVSVNLAGTVVTATAPPHTAATVGVAVTTAVGTSGTSPYVYDPVIAITTVTPASGPAAGGTPITIDGRAFTGATGVDIGGTPATNVTVVSDTRITATTPAGATGPANVVVHGTAAVGGDATAVGAYSYIAPQKPAVTSYTPQQGPSTGGTTVLFTGTGFTGATGVQFGGVPATGVQVISDTALRATTAARTPGQVSIVIQHPNGDTTIDGGYTYTPPPAPTEASIDPVVGPTAGGTATTITGTGFTGATGVTFGGTAGTAFTVVSPTQITVTAPAHAAGPVDVVVQHPSGDATLTGAFTFQPPAVPNVTTVAPASGTQLGGTVVTITGTDLGGTTGVTFGGTAGTGLVVTPTQVTVTTPAHAPGLVDLIVQAPGGDVTRGFTFIPDGAPVVVTHTPVTGPTAGGTDVTITGTDLDGVTAVQFGTTNGTIVSTTATQIVVTSPLHAAGSVDLVLRDPAGDVTIADGFLFRDPQAPTAAGLTPLTGPTAGGTNVTITGTGFSAATGVTFGGVAGTSFTVVSDTQITVASPAHAAGPVAVVVQHPDGASAPLAFTYTVATPVIGALTPNTGSTEGGEVVRVTGTALGDATAVSFGGSAGTSITRVDADTIDVTTPAHAAGAVGVTVTTPGGTSLTLAGGFTFLQPAPQPTIGSLTPVSGPTGGGTTVTITGTGFTGTTGSGAVTFGGTPAASYTVVSDTQISAVTPAHAAGAVDVVVTAPGGTATQANGYSFRPGPEIVGLTPASGPTAGGTSVTIIGSSLTDTGAVSFGGVAATSFVVDSDTQITAVAPAHAQGAVDVVVTTPFGGTTSTGGFTYLPPAAATGVSPASGPDTGQQTVTITGTGFTGATGVTIGGTAATNVTVVDAEHITATTPAHAAGTVDVVVQHPAGDSTLTGAYSFISTAPLTASGFTPTSGSATGGTTVTISGSGFTGSTGVTFGGTAGVGFSVSADGTSITVTTPAHAAGDVPVVVQHPNGDVTLADPFTFTAIPPSIQTIAPNTGDAAGGTAVTISGPGLGAATAVSFGGTDAGAVTRLSDDSISVVTPAHAAGAVDVVVTLPTTTLTSTDGFTYTGGTPVPPTASGLAPASGGTAGGTVITITGTGLTGTTGIAVDGVVQPATVVNDTTVTVTSPAHAAGPVGLEVQHPNGNVAVPGSFTYVAPPAAIDTITPNSGPAAGDTTVTISGSGLGDATGVTFGGLSGTQLVRVDADTITVHTPAHSAGAVDVVVTLPTATLTKTAGFTYTGAPTAPTASSIAPATGSTAGGTTTTITGTGFTGATGVTFDGTPGTSFSVTNDTTIVVTSPAGTAGDVPVVVQHPNGTATVPGGFTYTGTAPSITAITPNSGPAAGGTTVTITGPGIGQATGVTFGGTPGTNLDGDADSITVTAPAHSAGAVDVVVTLPTGPLTSTGGFTYTGAPVAPTATGLDPSSGATAGGTTVVVDGTGFTGATGVTFGGTAGTSFTVTNDTTITVTTPAGTAGNAPVIVQHPNGDATVPGGFTYTAPPASIQTIAPNSGPAAGGTSITITGPGIGAATGVTFGGAAGTALVSNGADSVTVTAPAHSAGAVDVVVTLPSTTLTSTGGYTYTGAPVPPTATSLTPTTGGTAGGTTVTITGTGFTGATGVTFDGVAGGSFTVVNDTTITVAAPAHATGSVPVLVQHPDGTATVPGGFTYVAAAPSIQSVSPNAGPADGGTVVTISGPSVGSATAVTIGGTPATGLTVVDANTITVVNPAHAPGAADVVVTLPTVTLTSVGGFTFAGVAPSVGTVSPSAGPAAGGTTVTLGGTGLTGTTGVEFGGTPGTNVTVVDDSTVTVVAPPHAPGNINIVVRNPKGDVTVTDGYGYVGPNDPIVTDVSHDQLPTGGVRIRIFGRNFANATGVTFDGVLGSGFTVIDDNTIEVIAPPHAPGRVQVRILTATGGSLPWEMVYVAADPGTPGDGSGPSSSAAGSGGLAATGTDGGRWVFGALAMLFAGAALLLRGARRRRFSAR
ncbi:IPT/TIG domain-containing protein [Schumannella soli]|nr:IPT/TIG domain-containing protein [Schumannella soli]